MKQFAVTSDLKQREWFDTFQEALDQHGKKERPYTYMIEVYVDGENIGDVNFNPVMGYFATGFIDDERGVDLFEQHGIYEDMRGLLRS